VAHGPIRRIDEKTRLTKAVSINQGRESSISRIHDISESKVSGNDWTVETLRPVYELMGQAEGVVIGGWIDGRELSDLGVAKRTLVQLAQVARVTHDFETYGLIL